MEAAPWPYCSFLVRFWFEPGDNCWHGEVEHVQSQRRAAVSSMDDVRATIAAWSEVLPLTWHASNVADTPGDCVHTEDTP